MRSTESYKQEKYQTRKQIIFDHYKNQIQKELHLEDMPDSPDGLTYIQAIPVTLNNFPVIAWQPILRGGRTELYLKIKGRLYAGTPAHWAGICYRHNYELHPYVCFHAYRHNIDDNNWAEGHYYSTMEEALECFQNMTK